MATPTKYDTLAALVRDLQAAERKSLAAMQARGALSPGGTRARVTTANARWANAAEHRDRLIERVAAEARRLGLGAP
jgi:hypothetical protein